MGAQNKVIIPIYDIIDETYVWSWAELNGDSGEWILGSLQHKRREQQRAKESWLILKTAIRMEQARICEKRKISNGMLEREQERNREALRIQMLQQLEKPIEGGKINKEYESSMEIRRGMLHSQLIGEQMRGVRKLREDTAQKMKTIELTKEEYKKEKN